MEETTYRDPVSRNPLTLVRHPGALFLMSLAVSLLVGACARPAQVPLKRDYPTDPLELPQDLAAHAWAQTEWWYYTGHLEDEKGQRYGFELTFFRHRLDDDDVHVAALGSRAKPVYLAHFAVVDEQTGVYLNKAIHAWEGKKAAAAYDAYDVFLRDWTASGDEHRHRLHAVMDRAAIDLVVEPLKPAVPHGDHGITPKGEGMANYYFSYTRLAVSGTLTLDERTFPVTGTAWFDHEFGYMGNLHLAGWDWFSLQLEDDTEIMIYAIHRENGTIDEASRACRVDAGGTETCIPVRDITMEVLSRWRSPHTGATYPQVWHLVIDPWGVDVLVIPRVADQEFVAGRMSYWEGSCLVLGHPVGGLGYVELVGYAGAKAPD